ncbi:MAG: DNA polymerase III subunit delta [Bradymonadaceae bacterium]|nr:DNA polymerase III subunit delta [Lujinxingiaceae bacterium]
MGKNSDSARDFFKSIKSAPIAPIYYLHGAETYLLDKAVAAIIEAVAPGGLNEFNFNTFHAKSATGDQIRSAVEMLPMFVPKRVVVVRDLQEIVLSELDALDDYFDNPSPSTCLILHARTAEKSLNGNSGIVRKLKRASQVFEFKAFYESEVGAFIAKQAAGRKMRLSSGAQAYLVEAVGTDLAQLDVALEKVDLYIGAAREGQARSVELEDVEAIIAQTRVRSVFDLTDALGNRSYEQALKILEAMLVAGDAPLMITAMVARHFRVLSKLGDPTLRSAPSKEIASAVGVAPFFLRDYQRHAQKFSPAEIDGVLSVMLEVDIALKSSKLSGRTILDGLLYKICFREGSARGAAR